MQSFAILVLRAHTAQLRNAATIVACNLCNGAEQRLRDRGTMTSGRASVATRRIVSPYVLTAAVAVLVIDVVLLGITNAALLCPLWMLAVLIRLAIRRRDVLAAVVNLAIAASVMTASVVNSGREERLMMEQLRTLEHAICRFHEANGNWPKRLESLVPRWLDRLPDTRWIRMLRGYLYLFRDDEPPSFMHRNRIGFWQLTRVQCDGAAVQQESVVP